MKVYLEYDFTEREEQDLTQMNMDLAALRVTHLSLEEFDGYLCTESKMEPSGQVIEMRYRYGFDRAVLEGEREEGEPLRNYQISAEVTVDKRMDSDRFHELWSEQHPDRVMRSMTCIAYENALAFIVLHHERG